MTTEATRVLVVGASGYVGGWLVDRLVSEGIAPVIAGRDVATLRARWPGLEARNLDLEAEASIAPALACIDIVYYLAHSMDGLGDFVARESAAARAFGHAAAGVGVRRIIFLGALGDQDSDLSVHLASRQRTGADLRAGGVPVTELRAAVIVGSGSASFEILRHLVERLPVMITPRWVRTRCQPISIDDVLAYLVAALHHPEVTGVVEIGGMDVLSYGGMMARYAKRRGLRRVMIPVPLLTPRLSSYWVHIVSPVPAALARPLVEGLRHEVVVRDPAPAAALGVRPLGFDEALTRAVERRGPLPGTWFDAAHRRRQPLSALESLEGMYVDRREREVEAPPEVLFAAVSRIGGHAKWPNANLLWAARGLIDRAVGGPGLRRGRRDPVELRVGDVLDFWRVEAWKPGELVRLAAEMRLPGRAWLQFEVLPVEGGRSRLVQSAFFEPRGLLGFCYWWSVFPFHAMVFGGMIGELARRAEAAAPTREAAASGASGAP